MWRVNGIAERLRKNCFPRAAFPERLEVAVDSRQLRHEGITCPSPKIGTNRNLSATYKAVLFKTRAQSLKRLSKAARASLGRWLPLLDVSFSTITRMEYNGQSFFLSLGEILAGMG